MAKSTQGSDKKPPAREAVAHPPTALTHGARRTPPGDPAGGAPAVPYIPHRSLVTKRIKKP
jgi:hypothetical protein